MFSSPSSEWPKEEEDFAVSGAYCSKMSEVSKNSKKYLIQLQE